MGTAMVAVFIMLFVVVLMLVLRQQQGQAKGVAAVEALLSSGTPAQALLVSVSPVSTMFQARGHRYEQRDMTLDIEEPGKAPYEVSVSQIVPAYLARYTLPGATFEVRVDAKQPGAVALVGPCAGFSPEFTGGHLSPRLFYPTSRL